MNEADPKQDYSGETAQAAIVVDLIIPARDEQENIPRLFRALRDAMDGSVQLDKNRSFRPRHIIVVNNGSNDQTAKLAAHEGAVVVDENRRGYGAACQAGLLWIKNRSFS